MSKISFIGNDKTIEYQDGDSLLKILLDNKIYINNPCNGMGTCGKCKAKVLYGNSNNFNETEKSKLTKEEINNNIHLSCAYKPIGDIEVEILEKELKTDVLTSGFVPKFEYNPSVKKSVISIHKPDIEDQTPYENQILNATGAKRVSFDVIKNANFTDGIFTAVIYDDEVKNIEEGDTTSVLYGVAIDIGTTTVVCELVDINSGKELTSESEVNAQKTYGLDVLTRITYELENPDTGVEDLQKAIVQSINKMIKRACEIEKISTDDIYEVTVGANCTMMHMLLGIDATSIGKAPYAPVFANSMSISANSIGLDFNNYTMLYTLPSVSAYIGADIVAGAYVCDLKNKTNNTLFIDIGTNGEIVFSNKGRLLCCSCAAGPALEGMNITSGMRASKGAIEDMVIGKDCVDVTVIGKDKPIGLCGSGILAAIRELLEKEIISPSGAFIKPEKLDDNDFRKQYILLNGRKREFVIKNKYNDNLKVIQSDVRQVQLAKGAILSGFLALLNKADVKIENLDEVMIAGQFGAHLPKESLVGVGILPKEVEDKLVYVGNSSKTGAYMALMSKNAKYDMENLAQYMDYLELGASKGYERLFSDCLIFPKPKKNGE